MKNWFLIACCALGLYGAGGSPGYAQTENYIGEIRTFSFNFCPVGWVEAKGQLLPINSNAALFALIGKTYGGDGTTNFAVPSLKLATTTGVSLMQCVAVQGIFPVRN